MGRYEVADFVLLLNSYAISGERTLADFFKALAPVKEVLMGAWGRYASLPSGKVPLRIELESISRSRRQRSCRTAARVVRVGFGAQRGTSDGGNWDIRPCRRRLPGVRRGRNGECSTTTGSRGRPKQLPACTATERPGMCAGVQRAQARRSVPDANDDRGGTDEHCVAKTS